ncbi:hypothetical protein DIPPA_27446 [Diplonema papillatum]|nr:hypothetical protein DIPPA_27446 [Diplonema papillatum]
MGYNQGYNGWKHEEMSDVQPSFVGGADGVAPPASSNLHSANRLVLIACDPECLSVADSITAILKRDVAISNRVMLEVDVHSVGEKERHKDVLKTMLEKYHQIPTGSIFILSFIKDGNPEEYTTVKQWCAQYKPPVSSHVITCTMAMTDPSLLIRNVAKAVVMKLTGN